MLDAKDLTIAQGIKEFMNKYLWDSQNTKRMYYRAAYLLTIYLLFDHKYTEVFLEKPTTSQQAEMQKYIKKKFLDCEYSLEPKNFDQFEIKMDTSITQLSALPKTIYSDFFAWIRKQNLSDSTLQVYLSGIITMIDFLAARDFLTFSSVNAKFVLQESGSKKRKSLESKSNAKRVDENFREKMIQAAMEKPLPSDQKKYKRLRVERLKVLRSRAVICTLAASALRVSDLVRLTTGDLDKAKKGDLIIVENQKTGEEARIYLHQDVIQVIEAYLDERNDDFPNLFIQHGKSGKPVKTSGNQKRRIGYGQRLSEHTIRVIVKEVAKNAGYFNSEGKKTHNYICSPHAFRHAYAQGLREKGVPLDVIKNILGHKNQSTTEKHYAPEPQKKEIVDGGNKLQALPGEIKEFLAKEANSE